MRPAPLEPTLRRSRPALGAWSLFQDRSHWCPTLIRHKWSLISDDFVEQAHQVFKNLIAVAEAAGGGLADCVKFNIYLTDLGRFADVNSVMAEYVPEPYPARAAVEISALPKGAQIEIDAIMVLN